MPGYNIQVPGGVSSYEAFFPQVMPPLCLEGTVIWDRRWTYQRRSPDTVPQWDQTFISTGAWWPMMSSGAFNDPADAYGPFMNDLLGEQVRDFAGWECGLGGSKSAKYIMGQCKTPAGNPVPGAVVKAFRTSDQVWEGTAIACDDKGYYEIVCPNFPNDAHFATAFVDSVPDLAGMTTNTLIPTWRDGSV